MPWTHFIDGTIEAKWQSRSEGSSCQARGSPGGEGRGPLYSSWGGGGGEEGEPSQSRALVSPSRYTPLTLH